MKISSVAKKVNAKRANVSKCVKTIMTAYMMIIVQTISACPRDVKKIKIVDRAMNALLSNVSLDVYIKDNVRMAKTVLITFVPFLKVIICLIYILLNLAQLNRNQQILLRTVTNRCF